MFNTEDEILRRLQEKNLEMAVMFYTGARETI